MKLSKLFTLFATILVASSAFALPFNSKLSEEDISRLQSGEVLIRNIDKYKNMSIESDNPGVIKLRETIKDLGPNYLAEVIQVRPVKENDDTQKIIYDALFNISDYVGIPYHSEHSGGDYFLYDSASIIRTQNLDENTLQIYADLFMEPFGLIHSPIIIEKTDDYVFYTNTNNNSLKYKGFTCVNKHNMVSAIALFRDGDNWILYGCGGVKALKVSWLEERIEVSFINRIKTFCNYIFSKI